VQDRDIVLRKANREWYVIYRTAPLPTRWLYCVDCGMPTTQYSAGRAPLYLIAGSFGPTRVLNANGVSIASSVFAELTM